MIIFDFLCCQLPVLQIEEDVGKQRVLVWIRADHRSQGRISGQTVSEQVLCPRPVTDVTVIFQHGGDPTGSPPIGLRIRQDLLECLVICKEGALTTHQVYSEPFEGMDGSQSLLVRGVVVTLRRG